MTESTESIALMELVHIQLALKARIIHCDKQIADCKELDIDPDIWISTKANINSGLLKLEAKYNKGEL
jgi:hypothetical protein